MYRRDSKSITEIFHASASQFAPTNMVVAAITADGAANEQAAGKQLVRARDVVHCHSHRLHLVVSPVLNNNNGVAHRRMRAIITAIRGSTNLRKILARKCKDAHVAAIGDLASPFDDLHVDDDDDDEGSDVADDEDT